MQPKAQQQPFMSEAARQRAEELALKNRRTGLTIFQWSWIMAFISLVVVNLQLRNQYPSWPPPDVEPFNPILPTIATLGLILSVVLVNRAHQAIKQNEQARFLAQWGVALVLGLAFILVMAYEWMNADVSTQYGVLFRLMTAFHGLHALVIGGILANIYRAGRQGRYHSGNTWAVEAGAKLWYFVLVAWLLFYLFLYWI